jgi:N-methylhydantoinase B
MNAIQLSIFSNRLDAVCEEMGAALQRSAFSPNIRDRLDYSCAVFDASGELCAQAAHIPVHLGSMAYAMRDIVSRFDWQPGDMVILNDPYKGGTHLPDVTLIAPLIIDGNLCGFVVNRAHHADIGSEKPGSMPISGNLHEEGLVIEPKKLVSGDELDTNVLASLMAVMKQPQRARGDFIAQVAANRTGLKRLVETVAGLGVLAYQQALIELNAYAERLAHAALAGIPNGEYSFEDVLDDDGLGTENILIRLKLVVSEQRILADFTGTAMQVAGNVNCPLSVTAAAVYYVFRCLLPDHAPACAGCFRPVSIQAEPGSLLRAGYPAAVAAGNVETSSRIVDVVLGALAQAIPHAIPAAAYGSMNNLAMGSTQHGWDYYETIGGGMGASQQHDGLDAVQAHMTNTLNTPIESLEMHYPLRINRYQLRRGSGGAGKHRGGDGIIREYTFLQPAEFTLLTERRTHSPWGLHAGADASRGVNALNGKAIAGKVSLHAEAGDVLVIETPGGGGYGD